MAEESPLSFRWALPVSEVGAQRDALQASGAELELETQPYVREDADEEDFAHAAFEPLTLLLGVAAARALAAAVFSFVRDARRSGVIVDVRGDVVTVTPEPSLDRGAIVAVTADGVQVLDASRPDSLVSVLKVVASRA
jgi:hypothetical protein